MFETSDDMLMFPFEEEMVNSLFSEETMDGKVLSLAESLLPLVESPSSPLIPWMCSTRYKTELCSRYAETGACKYAQRCQFAHGLQDLHMPSRHPKYKTELCRTYHTAGYCIYGTRCLFVHSPKEQRPACRRRRNVACRTFVSFGVCPFGTRCNFIHVEGPGTATPDSDSAEEERSPLPVPSKPLAHPQSQEWKPRGALCRTFNSFGFCLYGTRCRFQHGLPSAVKGSHHSQTSSSQLAGGAMSPGSLFSSSCSSPTSTLVSPLDPEDSSPLTTPAEQPMAHNAFTFSCQHLNDLLLPLALRLQQLEQSDHIYKGADAL
ncbi:cysteine three histidine 1 [Osmerus eperlanus]|uniref:cysteine three histidine 1 n=1 Tax=Osmerus eperlanus TaxID=29151 RepID=UPI002E10626E